MRIGVNVVAMGAVYGKRILRAIRFPYKVRGYDKAAGLLAEIPGGFRSVSWLRAYYGAEGARAQPPGTKTMAKKKAATRARRRTLSPAQEARHEKIMRRELATLHGRNAAALKQLVSHNIVRGTNREHEVTPPENRVFAWTLKLERPECQLELEQTSKGGVFFAAEVKGLGYGPPISFGECIAVSALEEFGMGIIRLLAHARRLKLLPRPNE
jgi:hypothetical protein